MSLKELRKRFKSFGDWMTFMYLLSEADECGFVHKSIREIVKDTGVPQTNLWRSIKRLSGTETEHFLEHKEGVICICDIDSYKETFLSCGTPFGTKVERSAPLAHANNSTARANDLFGNIENNSNNKEEDILKEKSSKEDRKEKPKEEEKVAAKAATNIQKRKTAFYDSLIPYLSKYDKGMVREFYDYWSEMNRSETKMRFELEKTWEVGRRLATWASRDNKPKKNNKSGMNVGVILDKRPKYTKGW